ncbi:hypothetical protein GCM10018781_61200 [Kitasatospora indigofera]|uniref:Uncharacterized protein n=1 Tax=Kitasatospora indigofera TaxID=67307 RepID=A0A919G9W6_9ACTN|nr:hypothetical protein [Kitasatospora indigofera]GHH80509.1 hypothetical protein GCM10018781_61200 [Kitasatospora indigofera]
MAGTRDLRMLLDSAEPASGDKLHLPDPLVRRALSVVASYARDPEDCRLLLQVLGLMPDEEQGQDPSDGDAETDADTVPAPSPSDGAAGSPERRRLRP